MTGRRPAIGLLWVLAIAGAGSLARAQDPSLVTIPVDFEINGRSAGQVVMRARPDLSDPAIQGSSLKSAIADRLTPTETAAVEALLEDFVPIGEIRARGIDLVLDLERLVVVLKAAERVRTTAPGRGTFRMSPGSELRPEARVPEANISAYTNFRLQDTLLADGDGVERDQPFTADMQSVLNIRGWAFSANTLYSSRPTLEGSRWTVGDLTLTHDMPAQALRWTMGDLSSPIGALQAGTRMGGISLSREFTLQPYENYQPTGTAAFQLQEAATVEVHLNGVRVRTLKLEAGTYNLEDFNLAAGANDLVLHITSVSGRFEEINVTQFTARTLLRRGLSEFALSAGFPMAAAGDDVFVLGDESWLRKYYQRDAVVTGFFRRGLTDTVTAEINAQGSAYWRRAAAGMDLASPVGSFDLYAALNRHRDTPSGVSVTAGWERGFRSASLRLSTAYTDPHFTQILPEPTLPGRLEWNHAATLSLPLPRGLDHTTSAFYQTLREAPPAWGVVMRFSKRVGSFGVSLNLQGRRTSGRTDMGGFVSVSWTQAPALAVRTVVGAGDRGVNPGFSTEANYTRRNGSRFTYASVAVESDDEGDHYTGGVRYQDNSFLAELTHRQVYGSVFGQEQRNAETVGTLEVALAYADGAWGVTRRVEEGFAIVTTHPRWRDVRLGIDPAFGGFEYTVRPPLHAAVVAQLRSYHETTSFIQTVDSDQVLENNDYVFFPSYRRGTRVEIGSDAVYTIRGTLVSSDGGVVSYQTLTLSRERGPAISGFTNVVGRFVLGPIAEGTWRITCATTGEWVDVEVGGDATFIRLETMRLRPAE